ncbi:MAG: hypothetical protein IPG04_27765 [Polyangiaceae bacterium]|nr:hypothetical protein [Polyangiaceae bacterium]
MSGPWRFTDEHGVEQTIGTEELRAALSSGKLPSATLVWRDGMDRQPAFTVAELASAAIAAARRSVPPASASSPPPKRSAPPPLPMRRPKSRPAMRTLTGIEPAEVEMALAIARGDLHPPSKELHPPPPAEAPDTVDLPMVRGTNVSELADEESWNDATDVIPRAPGLPYDVLKLAAPRPLIPTPPPPAVTTVDDAPKRTTVMGIGQRQGLAPRPATVAQAQGPSSAPRSRPPPPPQRKKSEPPPPPQRLQRTLEIGVVKTDLALTRPGAAGLATASAPAKGPEEPQKGRSRPPPPPAHRRTDRMGGGATPAAPAVSSTAPKVPSRPPPRPGAATPQPPSVDLGAAPNADTLTAPAVPEPAASAALSASPAPEPTAVPAAYDLGEPAGPPPRPKQNKTLEMVAPAAAAKSAKPARPTPASPTGGAEAKRATNLEDAIRKPLSAENTEIMIRDAPAEPLPTRSPTPTLEMAIADHSAAASKDPAPPESKSLKAEEAKEAHDAPTSGARAAAAKAARVVENTDSTAVTEHGDGDDDDDGNETDDDELQLKRPAMQVPMSAVLGVSAAWVIGLVVFFFVGRVSGFKSAGNQPTAKEGLEQVFLEPGVMPVTTAVASAMTAAAAEPKPCWVTRQPRRWAESASKTVPFDMRPRGDTIDLGFALGENKAAGLRIDPKAGTAESVFTSEVKSEISRVSPSGETFYVGESGERGYLPVAAAAPFYLVLEKGSIGAADTTDGSVEALWKLEGEEPITAEQVTAVGDSFLLTFRRGNDVIAGYFGADKKPKGELGTISSKGSEERNGKPRAGTNGAEVVVAYAVETRLADEKKEWRLTLAKSPVGSIPTNPVPLELPANGPGGDAIAPDLIGLADGRWLLMWTEGTSGARAIRAQTYDKTFQAIGDPIALSPPAGSFGQAMLGVAGEYTTVAFLQAADEGFEMWGAVLRCGP